MGDATEDIIETLDSGSSENVDEEEIYHMADTMSQCGGLEAALTRYVGWGVGVCMGDWRQPSLGMWGGELVCVWGTGGSPH